MEARPGVVFAAHHVRLVSVWDEVTDVPQNRSFCRLAISWSLQAVPRIPGKTDVQPFPGWQASG